MMNSARSIVYWWGKWPAWIGYAASIWSLAYGLLGFYWISGGTGYPFGESDPTRISILSQVATAEGAPVIAILGFVASLAGFFMTQVRGRGIWRSLLIGFGLTIGVILLFIIPDYRILMAVAYGVIFLLGGPSGSGKTAVSYRLAQYFRIGITEIDDFQVLLERMTTPEQQPVLHFWGTHPAPDQLSVTAIMEQGLAVGQVMAVELEAVIANHLESQTPVVLEGDFIHPSLTAQKSFAGLANDGRVRAIFLYEAEEGQLLTNFLQR